MVHQYRLEGKINILLRKNYRQEIETIKTLSISLELKIKKMFQVGETLIQMIYFPEM